MAHSLSPERAFLSKHVEYNDARFAHDNACEGELLGHVRVSVYKAGMIWITYDEPLNDITLSERVRVVPIGVIYVTEVLAYLALCPGTECGS